jgi:molecular chaperone GrpE
MTKKTASVSQKSKSQKPAQDKTQALKNKLKKKEEVIKLFKKENESLKEQNLRKLADMENLKKRVAREKAEFYQYALSEFLTELFSILDNFERALGSKDQGEGDSFREGVEMIYKQYQELLIKYGAKPIETNNKKFDPHLHQAFITEESDDVDEPEVIEELQKGYTLHNRLLRPALVKVAVPKKSK